MGLFFGTDGLRGEFGKTLNHDIVFRCGNSLARLKNKCRVVVGFDTRLSGSFFASLFSSGVALAGGSVCIIGVCPTAGVAYLTQKFGFDFGVVISASHNPAEFNGIKIFDKNGEKLSELYEKQIEKNLLNIFEVEFSEIGKIENDLSLVEAYKSFLVSEVESIGSIKAVLDCANGASYKIAPEVFQKVGAEVVTCGNSPDGININKNCGSLNVEFLRDNVLKHHADIGFSFDGDSDRVIAVDEKGEVHDGDHLIYMLANFYDRENKLSKRQVVGTVQTNAGIEKALESKGISLLRVDVGDKYVNQKLNDEKLIVGGEQAGHIFLKDKLSTGDGILNALVILSICKKENKKLSDYFDFSPYSQINVNVKSKNKNKLINHEKLKTIVDKVMQVLNNQGRVLVRASGTEPYVRVMVEAESEDLCKMVSNELVIKISELEKEICSCVE
jgi:phosphoglucosamine mutase